MGLARSPATPLRLRGRRGGTMRARAEASRLHRGPLPRCSLNDLPSSAATSWRPSLAAVGVASPAGRPRPRGAGWRRKGAVVLWFRSGPPAKLPRMRLARPRILATADGCSRASSGSLGAAPTLSAMPSVWPWSARARRPRQAAVGPRLCQGSGGGCTRRPPSRWKARAGLSRLRSCGGLPNVAPPRSTSDTASSPPRMISAAAAADGASRG